MSPSRASGSGAAPPVGEERAWLVHGEDPGLVSQGLSSLLERLAFEEATAMDVEEYAEAGRGELRPGDASALALALAACRTPPFLSSRRIVLLRDGAGLDAAQVKELIAYLADPLESTVLVVVCSGKSAPAALAKAVRAVGDVLDAAPAATGRARTQWFSAQLRSAPLKLTAAAANLLEAHLGDDLARLDGLLTTLRATYGDGATVGPEEITPFLGSAGGVAPWDLTDAIDAGDVARAISALHRMVEAGERHPLQVLATLHRHFGAMLRLDGSEASDESAAASIAKMAPYPAKKALAQSRRLGHERVARAIRLLAAADLDLRGQIGWPPELVMEVLVARLARLGRERPATRRPSTPRP